MENHQQRENGIKLKNNTKVRLQYKREAFLFLNCHKTDFHKTVLCFVFQVKFFALDFRRQFAEAIAILKPDSSLCAMAVGRNPYNRTHTSSTQAYASRKFSKYFLQPS